MDSFILFALSLLPLSHCVTIRYKHQDIISKSKIELLPMLITCQLNDIVIIAAPILNTKAYYYLHKPNNDVLKLQIPHHADYNSTEAKIMAKYRNKDVKSIIPLTNSRVIHSDAEKKEEYDVVGYAGLLMSPNEFMVGPLLEEDHGNWVLSVYFKDLDDNWVEMFEVITIEIIERVEMEARMIRSGEGDMSTMHLRFAYPIKNLTSCELSVPKSTYDRFYDRSKIDLDRCGYVVHNLTKADQGTWKIIGVGKMVYEGIIKLFVDDDGITITNERIN